MIKNITNSNFSNLYTQSAFSLKSFALGDKFDDMASSIAGGKEKLNSTQLTEGLENWLNTTLGKTTLGHEDFVNLTNNYSDGFGTYQEKKWAVRIPERVTFLTEGKTISTHNYAIILANAVLALNSDKVEEGTFINSRAISEAGIRKYFGG